MKVQHKIGFVLAVSIAFTNLSAFAQQKKADSCYTNKAMEELFKRDPKAKERYEQQEKALQDSIKAQNEREKKALKPKPIKKKRKLKKHTNTK